MEKHLKCLETYLIHILYLQICFFFQKNKQTYGLCAITVKPFVAAFSLAEQNVQQITL